MARGGLTDEQVVPARGTAHRVRHARAAEQLALVAYVPADEFNKSASKVDVGAWMDDVLGVIGGEVVKKAFPVVSKIPDPKTGDVLAGTDGKITGKVVVAVAKKDADKGKCPLKDKDAAMGAAFAYLRSKGAFPDDDGDDSDDMIAAHNAKAEAAREQLRKEFEQEAAATDVRSALLGSRPSSSSSSSSSSLPLSAASGARLSRAAALHSK